MSITVTKDKSYPRLKAFVPNLPPIDEVKFSVFTASQQISVWFIDASVFNKSVVKLTEVLELPFSFISFSSNKRKGWLVVFLL